MAIYIGRKKIGEIKLGNRKVNTIHKGADLIYQAPKDDTFKFTIDTTLTTGGSHSDSETKSFSITFNPQVNYNNTGNFAKIEWGDGQSSYAATPYGITPSHTYANHGVYQIKISAAQPNFRGWLSGIKLQGPKIKSIDTIFPEGSFVYNSSVQTSGLSTAQPFENLFLNARNVTYIPANLFANIEYDAPFESSFYRMFSQCGWFSGEIGAFNVLKNVLAGVDLGFLASLDRGYSGLFQETFYYYAYTATSGTIPAGLFTLKNGENTKSFNGAFQDTFRNCLYNSEDATIPAGLFDGFKSMNSTDCSKMFNNTFYSYGYMSKALTIPAKLFSPIYTRSAKTLANAFDSTFRECGYMSEVGTIPAGLFENVSIATATNVSSLFNLTFNTYAYNSKKAQIPAGLFDSIYYNLGREVTFPGTFSSYGYMSEVMTIPEGLFDVVLTMPRTAYNSMFSETFRECGYMSKVATIPASLFSKMASANGTNFRSMFYYTFADYGGRSTAMTIPEGLFSAVNTTNGDEFTNMFYGTFYTRLYHEPVELQDVFAGMPNMDWVNAYTANGDSVLAQTFSTRAGAWLTGEANTVLKHFNFTPSGRTNMFMLQENLSDYETIDINWK